MKFKYDSKQGKMIPSTEETVRFPIAELMDRIEKPNAKMVGEDGNVFNLIAIARKSLHLYPSAFNEMWERIQKAKNYSESLAIMDEYVNIT